MCAKVSFSASISTQTTTVIRFNVVICRREKGGDTADVIFFSAANFNAIMNLGLGSSSSAATATQVPHPKRVAVAGTTEEVQEQLVVMQKALLDCTQKLRVQRSITLHQIKLPADHVLITLASKATAEFIRVQKEMKESGSNPEQIRTRLGHPSVHIVNEWLKAYVAKLEGEAKQKVEATIATWKGWQAIQQEVPHLKVCKMFGGQTKRVEAALPWALLAEKDKVGWQQSVTRTLLDCLELLAPDRVMLEGTAPPSDLERRLQGMLDKVATK